MPFSGKVKSKIETMKLSFLHTERQAFEVFYHTVLFLFDLKPYVPMEGMKEKNGIDIKICQIFEIQRESEGIVRIVPSLCLMN